jgi:glycosyltransferase involved in cell wall biosynthesis
LSSFGKRSIPVRLLAQFLFVAQAFVHGIWAGRLGGVLVSTSPPFAGFIGSLISRLRRVPLIWWVMDINPDQMIAAGKLGPRSLPVRLFDWMNTATLRQASAVVVLDQFMGQRILRKWPIDPHRLHVIPPWPQTEAGEAPAAAPNAFRGLHGLQGRFTVMYAGNHALQHPLDTLLDAARQLEEDTRITFVFVGGGAGKAAVDRCISAGAKNLRSFPYQPRETLADTLSAADVHVVSMGDDMVGIVHPCKIYGAMAVGRPILYFGPRASHAGQLMALHEIGWQVSHGDVRGAIGAIQEASTMSRNHLDTLGSRSTALVIESLSRSKLTAEVCDVIQHSAQLPSPP